MDRPLISLCMIARNEAEHIGRCLKSAQEAVDEMVVVDTGSSDQTVVVAQTMGARISTFAWNGDFSAARNFALDQARGEWVLVLDADEELFAEDASRVREVVRSGQAPWYTLDCHTILERGEKVQRGKVVRLFRREEFLYQGIVHEYLVPRQGREVAPPVFSRLRIRHYGYQGSPEVIQGKFHRYILMLEKAVADDPQNPGLLYYLGTYYAKIGEDEKALHCFNRAREIHREAPHLIKDTADCLRRLGRYDEALTVLMEGMRKHPRFTDLYFLLGTLALDLGRPDEARQAFETCLSHGEAPPEYISTIGVGSFLAHYNLGVIHEVLGETTEAMQHYLQALEANPRMLRAVRRLTVTLLQMMPKERVVAYLKERGFLEDEASRAEVAAAFEEVRHT